MIAIEENLVIQTTLVTMKDQTKTVPTRALFDTGST